MLMRTFNGMLESSPLFMSVGFVRHHSPFAISYIWFTTTPGYWLSDTASPAVKSQMFNFTLFWYGDWNARSDWSVQTKYFHAFLSPWKAEHFWYLHSVQSASFEVPNCVSFLFFYYFPLFGQRNLFSTSFSPIMKELPNYNYENFARRNFTFMKIYSLNLIYIYIYIYIYICASIWAPVLYGEGYLMYSRSSGCAQHRRWRIFRFQPRTNFRVDYRPNTSTSQKLQ